MSVPNHEREAAKRVYKDIVDHITTYLDDFATRSLEIGTWGETEQTITSSTIDILLFQIDHIRMDNLIEICKKHPCYLDCTILSRGEGESHLVLQFLWVDPGDSRAPRPRSHAIPLRSSKPSFTELLMWTLLASLSGGMLYAKGPLFGY